MGQLDRATTSEVKRSVVSRFLWLSPASLQQHPSLSNNPGLYNFVSSLDRQGTTHIEYILRWQNMRRWQSQLVTFLRSLAPSVMISFMECSDCSPRRTGRASWNNQRKNQDLSFGAMHLTAAPVTFPFESFTRSVTNGLLSLFILWVQLREKRETGVCLLVTPINSQWVYHGLPLFRQHVCSPRTHISWKQETPTLPEVLTSHEKVESYQWVKCHQLL